MQEITPLPYILNKLMFASNEHQKCSFSEKEVSDFHLDNCRENVRGNIKEGWMRGWMGGRRVEGRRRKERKRKKETT